jgi:heme/copper-type cytochrome/quinol oxidase subunit 1
MLVSVLAFVLLAARSAVKGDTTGDDPWDGLTLEWATTSPAPADNFAALHAVRSAEPLLDLKPSTRSDA